jgi:hypothetical protein
VFAFVVAGPSGHNRFRVPAIPFYLPIAAVGLNAIVQRFSLWRLRKAL